MPAKRYLVDLTQGEREQLLDISRRGKSSARKVKRSLILCKADEGLTDQQVAEAVMVGPSTVIRVRQRFVEGGLERALNDRACMEDVLDLYGEPYDPKRPVVNFDETSKQLVAEKKAPIPAKPGRRERFDYEYKRNGTRNLFMFCEPLAGWRHVEVTERRTMVDFAHQMKWLVDEAYPEAEKIRVVLDNLNIHRPASLYQAFEPGEARRVLKRLEFHYTPKHGSWLNMAEIEFGVFSR